MQVGWTLKSCTGQLSLCIVERECQPLGRNSGCVPRWYLAQPTGNWGFFSTHTVLAARPMEGQERDLYIMTLGSHPRESQLATFSSTESEAHLSTGPVSAQSFQSPNKNRQPRSEDIEGKPPTRKSENRMEERKNSEKTKIIKEAEENS